MIINDIFKNDLSQRIKEVIKVDDPDELVAAEEIEDYWVTEHIENEFIKTLDVYQESILSPTEEVNVWISGFFGSGKSSFAKVLGYILSNPELGDTTAAELFTKQLTSNRIKALLTTIHDQAPTLSVFVDMSSGRHVLREGESIVLPLYRELLSVLDYSRDPRLAELEYTLEGDGKLAEFEERFAEANPGKTWRDRRHRSLAANEASAAMHLLEPSVYSDPDSWAKGSAQYPEVTANTFAERALELIARRRHNHKRIMFIVDEVGQYVATDVQRMLDLQGVAQAFQKADGRLWLTATSQETLEDVVSALAGRRVELARVQDRFPIRVDLATSDIEEVVAHRVLAKTSDGVSAVRALYDKHKNQLLSNTTLEASPLGQEYTGDEFVTFYPMLPYQIPLFIRSVSAHRARGGAGPMLGGTNRTLIRLAQQLIINDQTRLGEEPLGRLATSAMAYDLLQSIVPSQWRFEIDQVEDTRGDESIEVQVAKSVALLADVPQVSLKGANLGVLLHSDVDAESLEPKVLEAIDVLKRDEVVRESEEGLRLQSPEEKDWEKRRRAIDLKQGQFHRIARESLSQRLAGVTASAAREFRLGLAYNDEKINDGDIGVRILEGGDDQLNRAVRDSRESTHSSDLFLVFEQSDRSWRLAEELHRSDQMIRDSEARSRTGDETSLLHEERKRRDRLQVEFDRSLEADLLGGSVVFHGTEEPIDGTDARSALASSAASRVDQIYTQLGQWAAPIKRSTALSILKDDDLSGLPAELGDGGLGLIVATRDGHAIDVGSPALSALTAEIERRRNFGQEVTGRYLENHFGGPPYGGDVDVVMSVVAAAMRAGVIEVQSDGAKLRSHSDARLGKVFGALPKFRAAAISPRVEVVSIDMRARVAQLLDDLTGQRTSTNTDDLILAVSKGLGPERDRLSETVALLTGAGLRVPEQIADASRVVATLLDEGGEEAIASTDSARLTIKEGVISGRKLHELLADPDRIVVLRTAARLVGAGELDLSEDGHDRLQRLSENLRAGNYADGFAELRGDVESVTEELRAQWEAARVQLEEATIEAQTQISAAVQTLTEDDQREYLRRLEPFRASDEWSFDSGPPTDRLRVLKGELSPLVDRIRWEVAQEPGIEVVQLRASHVFSQTVKSEEDLEALLAAIRTAADEALGDGKFFQLS